MSICEKCGKSNPAGGTYCEDCCDDTGTMAQTPTRHDDSFDWARYDEESAGARSRWY